MQNIASLVAAQADGSAVKHFSGAKSSPAGEICGVAAGQDHPFVKALSGFNETNPKAITQARGQIDPHLDEVDQQVLPQGGNVLPSRGNSTQGFTLADLVASLKDLKAELAQFNRADISRDQKIIGERLAAQLDELEHLIREQGNGFIHIPAWIANDIRDNLSALQESAASSIQQQAWIRQSQQMSGVLSTSHMGQDTQLADDAGKSASILDDVKLHQLSNIIQDLSAASQGNPRANLEHGLQDLLKVSPQSSDIKNTDTIVGHISGLNLQHGNFIGDKQVSSLPINTPFNQQGWSDEIGDRVRWLVNQNVQSAELRLNPPHLGPLDVKVTVQNDQMNILFTAHHAAVRDALESAIPRLREMFGDNGLNLVDVDISQHSSSDDQRRASADTDATTHYDDSHLSNVDAEDLSVIHQRIHLQQGLVDYYA